MVTPQAEFAIILAQNGFHVFPCEDGGKLPTIKDYPNQATMDPVRIKAQWNGSPHNIGISTSHFADNEGCWS